mgnify:CR=1 FL=1
MHTRIHCPECGSAVATDMTVCRACGANINSEQVYREQVQSRTNRMLLGAGALASLLLLLVSLRALD